MLAFSKHVEPEFIAHTAIYARRDGFMKDMPALLSSVLAKRPPGLLADVFKMVHPKPKTASRAALYAYLIGRPYIYIG